MVYVLRWIKDFLSPSIIEAIKGSPYSEDWIAGIACRETGFLIERYATKHLTFDVICSLMKGDYDKRKGETERQFHGFGFFQIDIGSYPDFVHSGDWKDPLKCTKKAISVLEEKREWLIKHTSLKDEQLDRAITASYNCGAGTVYKALARGRDVDYYTFDTDKKTIGGDYSRAVWGFREQYKDLK